MFNDISDQVASDMLSVTDGFGSNTVFKACLTIIETILETSKEEDVKKLASCLLRFSSYLCATHGIGIEDAFDDFWVHFLTEKETAYLHIVDEIE